MRPVHAFVIFNNQENYERCLNEFEYEESLFESLFKKKKDDKD